MTYLKDVTKLIIILIQFLLSPLIHSVLPPMDVFSYEQSTGLFIIMLSPLNYRLQMLLQRVDRLAAKPTSKKRCLSLGRSLGRHITFFSISQKFLALGSGFLVYNIFTTGGSQRVILVAMATV